MFEKYPEAAGFLAAIRESPDDPTHRRALADWLEDHGDERAAWLRDADLWPWMTPDCHDPVPALLESRSQLLYRLGPAAGAAIREWVLEDPEERWWQFTSVISRHRPADLRPVADLIERLNDADWVQKWLAIMDLGHHGPAAAPAIEALCRVRSPSGFYEGDPLRAEAARVLATIGPAAVVAIPTLWVWVGPTEDVCEAALDALRVLGPLDPPEFLRHIDRVERKEFRYALGLLAEAHPERHGVLARILRGEIPLHDGGIAVASFLLNEGYSTPTELTEAERAVLAAAALIALQAPPEQASSPATNEYLLRQHRYLRHLLVQLMGEFGPAGRPAIPLLQKFYDEGESEGERVNIALTLARLGEATVLPFLRGALCDNSGAFREDHVHSLQQIANVPDLLPVVLAALGHTTEFVRSKAVWTLPRMMNASVDLDTVVPLLLTAITDDEPGVRSGAARCLGTLRASRSLDGSHPHDPAIVEALLRAVDDRGYEVHSAALDALANATLPDSVAGPLLALIARQKDFTSTAEMALRALERVREIPADQIPAARALLAHCNQAVREAMASQVHNIPG